MEDAKLYIANVLANLDSEPEGLTWAADVELTPEQLEESFEYYEARFQEERRREWLMNHMPLTLLESDADASCGDAIII